MEEGREGVDGKMEGGAVPSQLGGGERVSPLQTLLDLIDSGCYLIKIVCVYPLSLTLTSF